MGHREFDGGFALRTTQYARRHKEPKAQGVDGHLLLPAQMTLEQDG